MFQSLFNYDKYVFFPPDYTEVREYLIDQYGKFHDKEVKWVWNHKKTYKVPYHYYEAKDAIATVFYFHGNAEDINLTNHWLSGVQSMCNCNLIVMEYPSYPEHQRLNKLMVEPDYFDIINDAKQIILQHQNEEIPCFVWGRSLGCSFAIALAADSTLNMDGLISESGFTTPSQIFVPFTFGFRKYNNLRNIKKVSCKTLFMHGQQDEVIPWKHTKRLSTRCKTTWKTIFFPDSGHNDTNEGDVGDEIRSAVCSFVDEVAKSCHERN